jgi:hypothetical protein
VCLLFKKGTVIAGTSRELDTGFFDSALDLRVVVTGWPADFANLD